MEQQDIQEFAKGGRISPESSATIYPNGTLGVGNDGNVWINVFDKNGRLSWKPTEITLDNFSLIKFGYWSNEQINFNLTNNKGFIFQLRYYYNQESFLRISYSDGYNYELEAPLHELLDFFNANFDPEKFDLLNTEPNYNGEGIQSEVRLLFGNLQHLINKKGLRTPQDKPKENPTPEPKFKVGDKVKFPKDQFGKEMDSFARNDAKNEGKNYLTIVEISKTNKVVLENKNSAETTFTYDLDGLELYEEKTPEPKFKVGDKVKYKGAKNYLTVQEVRYSELLNDFEYKSEWSDDKTINYEYEDSLELYEEEVPESKFNVGDKVKRIDGIKLMTVLKKIYDEIEKEWVYDLVFEDGTPNEFIFESYLELYEQKPTPNPDKEFSLKVGEVYVRNFEDELKNPKITYTILSITAEKTQYRVDYRVKGTNRVATKYNDIIQDKIDDNWWVLYAPCEIDDSKITSTQVKEFYDNNKNRIKKLNSKLSCAIINSLILLSDYEKCGKPSSESLPKPKIDLLLDIENFKI